MIYYGKIIPLKSRKSRFNPSTLERKLYLIFDQIIKYYVVKTSESSNIMCLDKFYYSFIIGG